MVFIEEYVCDNESLCRKKLTHSYWDLLLVGRITEALWPRFPTGCKKPNRGLLPVEYRYFALVNEKTKELKLGCTSVDSERIKRRLSWTLRLPTKY
jgi:hypothetical protein